MLTPPQQALLAAPMLLFQRAVDLMEAEIGDEIVGLHVAGGTCFGFNGVASSVWRALETPHSFAALRDGLLDEYDVSREVCERELQGLLDDLAARGLIRSIDG